MPRAFTARRRLHSILGLLLEVALITAAVFLGLLADEWREQRQQEQVATRTLERFRVEVATNAASVQAVRQYHEDLLQRVSAFVDSDSPKSFQAFGQVQFRGIHPVFFEHSAWDVAIANGSLGYIDPDLAFELSRTYTAQGKLERMQEIFSQSGLAPTTFAAPDLTGLGIAMQAYLTDVSIQEPWLLGLYAELTADLATAVGGTPAPADAAATPSPQAAEPN